MKIFKKNLKGGNSHKAVKTASLFVLTLVFALVLCGAISAGTPLQVNQTGTVSGDLYVNTSNPWSSTTQGATNEVTQANTLPTYTSIDSAMVYVNVYSGSGSNNWPVRTTVKLDGNGDGDYDDAGELLGVEDMNIPGTTDGTVYWLNDHCNRVYSDYQVWYDVKNLITSNNPTLYVKTETMGGDGYDGRIKLLALCVAYNDGDTDKVDYWVLNGQDWINADTSPSTSAFNTSTFNGQVSSATLNTIALASTDGNYAFNGNAISGNLTETGTYYKEHTWDVTNQINTGADTNLTYANVGSSLKMNLVTLTIRGEPTPVGLADTAWPKYQNNNNNTGKSEYNGPTTNTIYWTYTTGGELSYGSPVIGSDGTIYVGSYDKNLYALNPDGTLKWTYTIGNRIYGSPSIAADGTIYVGGSDKNLYALNPDGTLKWSYTTDSYILGSAAIESDGTLYIGDNNGKFYAINPDGTLKWNYTTGDTINYYGGSPTIGSDGTIYVGSYDKNLYALNPDGTLRWSYTTGSYIYGSPAIGSDGTIYVGSRDKKLYALNPDGTLKWSYTTGSYIYGSPAIGSDGTIYVGSRDTKIYALNPDGTLKWSYTTVGYIYGSLAIGSDGTIYVGSRDTKIYALNPDGTLKWSYTTGGYIYESPAIGSDGTIYIGSNDGKLYAFKDVVPVVNFTADRTIGGVPITLHFTDQSLYATSWAWDFNGDGLTDSTEQNPSYTFTEVGTYVVSLTASNAFASNTTTLSIELSALPPVVNFIADVKIGTSPLIVKFTDQSLYATSWAWDFDNDGNIDSTEQNPAYTYQSPGNYSVTLTATGPGGSQSTTLTDYINVDPVPMVNFIADVTIGTSPLIVKFTDQSLYATSWAWDFDNDGNIDSTEQNPAYTYLSPGIYSVTLTVSNQGNTHSLTNNDYIIVVPSVSNSLSSGTYSSAQTVTLTSDDPTATIYYTTDNTDPKTSTTRIQYTTPITINSTSILLYAAVSSSGNWSPLYAQYYEFGTVGLANTAWPTFGRDLKGSGQSPYNGSAISNLAWMYSTGGAISSDGSASIGADGTIYVGSTDKKLYALNPNGTLKWTFTTGGTVYTPTVGSDGTIYIGSSEGKLYALNVDGTLKWSYTTTGSIQGAAKIGTDGTIYIAGGGLYALNQDGTLKWSYSTGSYTPVIGTDGTIYVTSGSSLYAINPDGTLKWSILLAEFYAIYGSPAIGPDGTIYVGSTAFALHAVNPNGTLKWKYAFPAPGGQVYYCSPVVGADGTIYIGTMESPRFGNNFYAINPDGTLKWGYATGNYVQSSAAIGADGTAYIGSTDGKLYALNSNGTLKWTYTTGSSISSSPSIGSDGTIYIGSSNGKLYALNIIPPVASFTANVVMDYAPLTVQFTDTSTENPSAWAWDFNNDGTIDSTEQNPTNTYTTPGTYTVKLTVSNEKGSNSLIKTDYIIVTTHPVDTESPTVTATPIGGNLSSAAQVTLSAIDDLDKNPTIYYTTDGTDPTTESTKYTGTITIVKTTLLKFIAADKSGNISPVQSETYTINDTEAPTVTATQSGTTVTLSATDNIDPDPLIYYTTEENDPTTNSTPYGPFTIPRAAITIVKFIAVDASGNVSPVQSKTFNTYYSTDILTSYHVEGNIGLVVDNGGTAYHGGDPIYNLSLPTDATILTAHLCLAWNWYGYSPYTVSFNGNSIPSPTVHYVDGNDGQDVYDVTQYFNAAGTNTATITGGTANYGRTLIVVYQSASEPYREIWVNEGYDILYSDYGVTGGSGNAFFKNATNTQKATSAEVIITLPSGDNDSPYIILNGQNFSLTSTGGSDPSFKYYNITTTALQNGTNTLEVPVGGSYFSLQNAVLALTLDTIIPTVTADIHGGLYSTGQTVTLTANDDQDTSPNVYYTTNGDTPTINSTLCTEPITIDTTTTLKLTATGPSGSDDEVKKDYITVSEPAPMADFVGVSTIGSSPLTVTFTDQSTNVTEWSWDFNDDGIIDSTDQNPTWIYDSPGTYTVKLAVNGPGGTDEETKTDYIAVNKSTQPDLLATEMKVTSSSYVNYSLVEVIVTNIGLKTTGFFNVVLYDNGTQVGEQYTYWMASDKDRTLYFLWSPANIGEHHIEAVIDQNNNIQESNENNNQITQLFDNRPDLTPTGLKAKTLPLNYCYVTVDVTNNGEDLTEFYDVTLYDNETQLGQQKIYGLRTGETKTVTFLCKLTSASTHNLEATTDATSTIPETNETNNTLAKQL